MTSIPASRIARAITLAPRSCPSSPGLAIRTRIGLSSIALFPRPQVYQSAGTTAALIASQRLVWRLREAEDAVVAGADGAAAVAVAGGEIDGAVGAVLDLTQAAVFVDEEGLGIEDMAGVLRIEAHPHETLADQAGKEEVALESGELRPGDEGRAGRGDGGRELQQRRDHPFARHLVVDDGPAVVLSLLDDVDFVPAAGTVEPGGAVLGLELQTRHRLPVQALRVAMTVGEDG